MKTATKFRLKIGRPGSGQWDIDSGTTHAVHGMTTLCGIAIRGARLVQYGGAWSINKTDTAVTCKRCKAKAEGGE